MNEGVLSCRSLMYTEATFARENKILCLRQPDQNETPGHFLELLHSLKASLQLSPKVNGYRNGTNRSYLVAKVYVGRYIVIPLTFEKTTEDLSLQKTFFFSPADVSN